MTVRCRTYLNSVVKICESLKNQGVKVEQAPYLPYAKRISGYNHILALDAFIQGKMVVQDVSSMLVAEIANPQKGDYVIDMYRQRYRMQPYLMWNRNAKQILSLRMCRVPDMV